MSSLKSERIWAARGSGACLVSLAFLFGAVLSQAEIVPLSRRIQWDPGVRGGIPSRSTIYTNLPTTVTTSELQAALSRCPSNRVVKLAPGTYNISSTLRIPTGVTLRGSGIGNTILKGQAGFSGSMFIAFDSGFNSSWSAPARNLVAPVKGSAVITTAEAHGWTPGDVVLIDMLEQPTGDPPIDNNGSLGACSWCGRANGSRPIGQWVKVVSVPSATTANIDPPLYWSYANLPQGVEMTGLTHFAGVEDLTVDNVSSAARDTVGTFGAVNCWLYSVELRGNYRRALWGYGALWFTMEKCHVVGGVPVGTDGGSQYVSDRAYGPFLGPHFTAGLITDSIFEKLTMGIAFEGGVSGNVFSYNLITNIWWMNTGDAPRRFGPLMHGPHPFMNLLEGNYSAGRIRADEYWGTSSHFTVLRNRVIQVDRGTGDSQTWTVDIERRNWYWSFVGNILGGGGGVNENQYELINGESAPYSTSSSTIWKVGYNSLGEGGNLYDADTLRTMIRWGNWSFRTNDSIAGSGLVFHPAGVVDLGDVTIPNSYYLSSKPAFFGSLRWPPYDPYNPTANSWTNIPAGLRYVYGRDPDTGPVNYPPTVIAGADKLAGIPPVSIGFSCTASDPEGAVVTYAWTFGDGTTSTLQNPSKTYSTEGTYIAYVTVSDGTNATRSSDLRIVVGNQAPVVAVSASPLAGNPPLAVTFSSAGTSDPEGLPLTFSWIFGDGATSTQPNPAHTYSGLGTFTARLTVSDGVKTSVSSNIVITVSDTPPGLVAAYSFDEGAGTLLGNKASSENTGAISGATWTSSGRYGAALNFNGTSDLVVINSSASLNLSSAMTLEAWVYPTASQSSWRTILHKEPDAYYLHASNPSGAMLPAGGGIINGTELYASGVSAVPINTWTHLAVTHDGATIRLYVNGVEAGTRSAAGSIQVNSQELRIGGNTYAGQFFAGRIDEVRIYNRALTAAQIQADMATPIGQAEARPAAPGNLRDITPTP